MRTLFGDVADPAPEKPVNSDVPSLWDHIGSLTLNKRYAEDISEYTPFIVNRALAAFPELLYHVDRMNEFHDLSKRMQYDYYFYAVQAKKRWKPWLKKSASSDEKLIELVCRELHCDRRSAAGVLKTLTEDQVAQLNEQLNPDKNAKSKKK